MGTEAVWIPLALAAAGAGASYVNTRNVNKQQDRTLADQIRQSGRRQQEATNEVNKTIDQTASSNPAGDKAAALKQYIQQLVTQQPQANTSFEALSGASGAYQGDATDASLGSQRYGNELAGLMSRIDAPQQQRRREGNMQQDLATAVDRIKRFNEGDTFISKLKLDGIRRNPLLDAFASTAMGAASGMAGGAGGVTTAGAPAGGGWLAANTAPMAGLTGADSWLKALLSGGMR